LNFRRYASFAGTKIAAAKKRGRGGNSFSPHPFFFPPRPSVIFRNRRRGFLCSKF